jgi:flagellar M-ring protein FliF
MDANVTALTPANAAALAAGQRSESEPPRGPLARLALLPARARLMVLLGAAGLLAVLAALALWSQQANFAPLFPSLSDKDAGEVMARLTQMNVPYKHSGDGSLLLVPADRVPELRLKMSQAGLPKGASEGWELLDNARLGQSQLTERTNLQRARQGELERSIATLSAVQAARVILALPQQSGFFREQHKPSASVTVTLHAGRTLDRAQVAAIVHMVSRAVPDLSEKAVSVVDQNANLLSAQLDTGSQQGLDTQQLQYVQQVEATHLKRVIEILEPALGRDNLRATVSAEIDFTQQESTSEAYRPNQTGDSAAVRSQRSTESSNGATNAPPNGVPGAASNQPAAAPVAPVQGAGVSTHPNLAGGSANSARRESQTNYEVDKTVSTKRNAVGSVRRLSVAVVVNHRTTVDAKGKSSTVALPPEELEKLTALVQESIGFNKERGDSVKVLNMPFRVEPSAKPEPTPLLQQPWLLDLLRAGAVPAALVAVALLLVLTVIRPALRQVETTDPSRRAEGGLNAVVDDAQTLPGGPALPLALEAPKAIKQLEDARALAKQNPGAVANIVRGWVSGESA